MYRTTKKDFVEFKKEVEYWIEYFGLKNWELFIEHEEGGELMLRDLTIMCEKTFNSSFVATRTHNIIRTLENTIFKEKRGK